MGSEHAKVLKVMAKIEREGASAQITRAQAVVLIVSRIIKGHEEERAVNQRVRSQMRRSHKKGTDVTAGGLACLPNRGYTVDEIVRWARIQYPGIFDDLPTMGRDTDVITLVEAVGFGSGTEQEVMPGNLADCQEELRRTRALLKKANWELQEARRDYERRLSHIRNFYEKLP